MSNVAALARDWLLAKQAEQDAAKLRIDIEEQLAAALGTKSEGSETHHVPGYRITLTQPISRRVDEEAWRTVAHHCPSDLYPVKYKLDIDVSGVRWLMTNKPAVWRKIAAAFTSKPGKINVKVEEEKTDGSQPSSTIKT